MSYELWDTASRNLVGGYHTEAEALEVVADLVHRYRSRRGKRLEWLALHQVDSPYQRFVVASGPELVARALASEGVEAQPTTAAPIPRRKRAAA